MSHLRAGLSTLTLLLATAASPLAFAQDSDGDGVADAADAFPCDASISAVQYAPSVTGWTMLAFEDQWPEYTDLDFNDVVVRAHYRIYRDAQGRAVRIHALFDPLALGGDYSNGLALQLPASRVGATARRRVGTGAWETLSFEPDANATMILSPNLRELFSGAAGRINSVAGQTRVNGQRIELEVTYAPALALNGGQAPFDVFIFRAGNFGHQIHLPWYRGTQAMSASLFNTGTDVSNAQRSFVHRDGTPFALDLQTSRRYPVEGLAIEQLFPDIIGFAQSAGATSQDFYLTNVAIANGHDVTAASPPAEAAVDTSCVNNSAGPFSRIDITFEEATATPWVTMWEIGLLDGTTRISSGYSVSSSILNAPACNDLSEATYCLNSGPPMTYAFQATSGSLPSVTGLMLHPWYDRYPSRFRVVGTRLDGTQVNLLVYTGGNSGWVSNVRRDFAVAGSVPVPPPSTYPNFVALTYNGSNQSYVVPAGVTTLSVKLWGAGGGGGYPSRSQASNGGGGGHTTALLSVTPGETLTVIVGGGGGGSATGTGGFGGGGAGDRSYTAGAGGGGRSGIRRGSVELVTAGGGGGGGYDYAGAPGGGATGGRNPGDGGGGYGATSSSPGAGAGNSYVGLSGSAFLGGSAVYAGGGGGGGYYGGGGAGTVSGYGNGGGGGSGYAGGAGVSSGVLVAGSGATAGGAGDADRANAGGGGAGGTSGAGATGSHGRVVITY